MTSPPTTVPTDDLVMAALATVDDPEIRRPITELGHGATRSGSTRTVPSRSRCC